MSYLLEREAQRLVQTLRAMARDARQPGADPAVTLPDLAEKLEAAASGMEHELAELARARQREAARPVARGDERLWREP